MRKNILALLLLGLTSVARSQGPVLTTEDWNKQPVLHPIDPRYRNESAIILLDRRRIEFVDEGNDKMSAYRTMHRIIRVNDDNGIESFNRVYLGITQNSDIVDIRARTILPSGRIIEIDKQNIKDLKEEDGNLYKIFAMEGLEKGCEVEYSYTFKYELSFIGRELIQSKFPVLDAQLEIIGPQRLFFQLKGYNCTMTAHDTSLKEKRISSVQLRDIPGADKEKYAYYNANLEKIEYKLSYNKTNGEGRVRIFTWDELAKRVYSIYGIFTEKELNTTGQLINANGWNKLGSDQQKITAVEGYLKKQFASREDIDNQNAGNLEWIIKNKIASHHGMIRLYGAIFEKLGVVHQVVLTCNREETGIDKSFENWNNASEFLFYFPGTKKFLAPTLPEVRYPWINPYWGAQNALFCKTTTIGSFTTAMAEIKPIPLEDYDSSYSKIEASLRFDAGLDTLLVDLKESYAGYNATGYRGGFLLATPDDQHAMIKEMVKSSTNSESIVSSRVDNAGFESFTDNKPFTLSATVKSGELLENAGSKILVKIGDIIGPQIEMYQEKPRQFPMQLGFPHRLERFIDFTIPEGYVIKNPDDLVMQHALSADGELTAGFSSTYVMEGNVIRIHVLEQYRKTVYAIGEYENFKKVINASADFNKAVLVLEKKK